MTGEAIEEVRAHRQHHAHGGARIIGGGEQRGEERAACLVVLGQGEQLLELVDDDQHALLGPYALVAQREAKQARRVTELIDDLMGDRRIVLTERVGQARQRVAARPEHAELPVAAGRAHRGDQAGMHER